MPLGFKNEIKIGRESVEAFLKDENGPVVRHLLTVGEAVKTTTIQSMRSGFPRNFLSSGIVKRLTVESNGPHVLVGSDRVTTRPHDIHGNPTLAFTWKKAGGLVFFRSVHHPGSNFTEYLTKKLLEAAAVVGRTNI